MSSNKHPTEKLGRKSKKADKSSALKTLQKIDPRQLITLFKGASKNVKLGIVLVSLLIITGGLATLITSSTEPVAIEDAEVVNTEELDSAPIVMSTMEVLEGTLQTKNTEGIWEDTDKSLSPTEGTSLRTVGAASRSTVRLQDGSEVRIDANSELEFISLSEDRVEISHISGYLYSRVVPSETRSYIVSSIDAQYESVGTSFKTSATGDEQSIEVYDGSVLETSTNNKIFGGEKLTVKSTQRPSDDGKIANLDIEAVKIDQFLQWNITQDLKNDLFKNSLGFLGDLEGPDISILSPVDGDTVLLDPSAEEGVVEFTGTSERNAKITVQSKSQSGSVPVDVTVDAEGKFTTPLMTAPLGSSVFEFIATDKVGNVSTKNVRVNFQRKSQPVISDAIVLTASAATKVEVDWLYSGDVSAEDGVMLVWDQKEGPTYEKNEDSKYISSGTSTTINFSKFDSGETYYFQVCEYDSDKDECGLYSNEVTVTIP
ncbi:MAG: hypothetical protein ACI9T8_000320 [Candidatus Saccharimonadales bacterium]|jgi:hypothetical protein